MLLGQEDESKFALSLLVIKVKCSLKVSAISYKSVTSLFTFMQFGETETFLPMISFIIDQVCLRSLRHASRRFLKNWNFFVLMTLL